MIKIEKKTIIDAENRINELRKTLNTKLELTKQIINKYNTGDKIKLEKQYNKLQIEIKALNKRISLLRSTIKDIRRR